MKLVITGAAGFIGTHLIRLLSGRHELFAISRGEPGHSGDGIEWIQRDLSSPFDAKRLPERVDAVVHLAQSRLYKQFPDGSRDVFGVNIGGAFQMLEYARAAGARHFILASSGGVYRRTEAPITDEHPVAPPDFYLTSKYVADLLAWNYRDFYRVIALRLFYVYGAGQSPTTFVARVAAAVRDGKPITLNGPNGVLVNPVHVDDVVRAIVTSLSLNSSTVINIGGPEVLSLRAIVGVIGRELNIEPTFSQTTGSPDSDLICDVSKMERLLGAPAVRFAAGVREVCAEVGGRRSMAGSETD